jgi:hypothetical protein
MYNQTSTSVPYSTQIVNPSVYLAVNGNRIKTYNEDNEVRAYLKDETEFQLEFHNDSDCYVKADITINGQFQDNSLVLRPHQHFYLERFMDEKKKFMFNTFLTGNDDIEKLKEIIAKNGRIEVRFYKELIPTSLTTWTTFGNKTYNSTIYTNTSTDDNIKYTSGIINESNSPEGTLSLDSEFRSMHHNSVQCRVEEPKEIETGRIEAGKKSNQEFKSISKYWEFFSCASFSYHIMPESQRPKVVKVKKQKNIIQADDIRTYCQECGRRVKNGWKFCPGCGNNV